VGWGWDAQVLDSGLESANVPYSYGFSIILLTLLVKIATFPLSKQQVESTMSMQVRATLAAFASAAALLFRDYLSPLTTLRRHAQGGSLLCCD